MNRDRVVDQDRSALPPGMLILPTLSFPETCTCTRVVVRPGPGWKSLSVIKRANRMCPHLAEHQKSLAEQSAMSEDTDGRR